MSEVVILRQSLEGDLSPEERAEALHDLAYALYRQGDLEEAILHAEDLLNTYPDYCHLGSVFWLLGVMYADCASWPEHLETWEQDTAAAENNLRRALDHIDDKEERSAVLVELGAILNSGAKLAEAQHAFEQALQNGIEEPAILVMCYQQLGSVFHRLDQVKQAKQYYEQAALVHLEQPNNWRAETFVGLASLCREQGDTDQAEQYIQQAKHAVDESDLNGVSVVWGSIYGEAGDISLEKDEYRRAVDNYQAALEQGQLPEKQQDLCYKLGVALQGDEQYERALEFLRQTLALELSSQPTDEGHIGAILYQMGQCVYNMRDFQQAVVLLGKATEKADRAALVKTHLLLGHSYYSLKRFDKAAGFYRKVMRETRLLSPQWKEAVKYLVWTRIA